MYAPANTLIRKYGMCSSSTVKAAIFIQLFVTRSYAAHLRRSYKSRSLPKLHVAYDDVAWGFSDFSKCQDGVAHVVHVAVPSVPAVLRHRTYRCMRRSTVSSNGMIEVLVNGAVSASVRFTSTLWNHWRHNLCVNIWILTRHGLWDLPLNLTYV